MNNKLRGVIHGFTLISILFLGHTNFIFAHGNPNMGSKSAKVCPVDNVHWVHANGECVAIQTYLSKKRPSTHPSKLLIFIHGDGTAEGYPSDYLGGVAKHFASTDTLPILLIRPGYYDSQGRHSTGEGYAHACEGLPCDGYRTEVVASIASAVKDLKVFYHPKCTILVGHSGGGMMSGIILGKYPHLADGAVLASVAYNVHEMARQLGWDGGNWPNSLSPHDWISKIPPKTFVYIVSGPQDKITTPTLAKTYYQALKKTGVDAHYISVDGGDHNSIVLENSAAFKQSIEKALQECAEK